MEGGEAVRGRSGLVGTAALLAAVVGGGMALSACDADRDSDAATTPAWTPVVAHRGEEPPWWAKVQTPPPPPPEPGRPQLKTFVIPGDVLFATGSVTVSARGRGVLLGMVPQLQGAVHVVVAGATDSTFPQGNQKLSEDRAAAGAAVLRAGGIAPELLFTEGWSHDRPVVDELTADDVDEARARNRRLVVIATVPT